MKKQHLKIIARFFIAAGMGVFFYSCIGGKSPAASFYTLTAAQKLPQQESRLSEKISIGVGPVTIPPEMDRPQILMRSPENQIKLSEFERWAAPLQENIASILSANLSILLHTERVIPGIHQNLFPITHHVVLNINRFDGYLSGEVVLDATWSILKSGQSEPLVVKRSVISEAVQQDTYADLVAAHSTALAKLSREIAASFSNMQM